MRKSALLFALLAGMVGAGGASAQAAQPVSVANGAKYAFVNSDRLIQQAPGANEARTTFQREVDKATAELNLLEDSIKNMVAEYQQRQVMLSPDAKKKQEDAIRAKENSFRTRSEQAQQALDKRQRDLVQPVMNRINAALEEVRKEGGYQIVFNSAMIVAADTTLDLTDKVLAKLRTTATAPKPPGN